MDVQNTLHLLKVGAARWVYNVKVNIESQQPTGLASGAIVKLLQERLDIPVGHFFGECKTQTLASARETLLVNHRWLRELVSGDRKTADERDRDDYPANSASMPIGEMPI